MILYRRTQIEGDANSNVKWEFVKIIEDYPSELSIDNWRLEIFSPCFSRYIVCDHASNQYVIKDTLLDKVIKKIPVEIMSYAEKSLAKSTIGRFKWINDKSFIIMNEEGVEKIIDVD